MMDVETLLKPVSDEAPTGTDMFEDADRQGIEAQFEDDPADVDWRDVIRRIEAQSRQTKDIWLAVYLARAGAQAGQLPTIVTGTQYLAGLCETYWDTMFPALDDYGFQGRKGPCESLTKIGPFLGPLKRAKLVEHPRLGSYSGDDLLRFASEGDGADGYGMFRHAVGETATEELQASIDALDAIRDAIRRTDAVLTAQADGDTGTDFKPTYETIETIRRGLAPFAGIVAEPETAPEASAPDYAVAVSASGPRAGGRVESRDDVIKSLDAIGDYYRQREPGSPIPVALKRVRNWVKMDFMSILQDIAPNSMAEAGTVLLSRPEEDAGSDY